jgi:endo-1,4-beta-mannosidase
MDPFLLGLNYWPRRSAINWWTRFDPQEVRDDFALIARLRLRLVRIFLLWEDWQPDPHTVSSEALNHFETVCDLAAEHGLQLDVTFFTGHMSGPNWVPSWLLLEGEPLPTHVRQVISGGRSANRGYRNPYSHPQTLAAEERLLEAVVRRFHSHPAIAIWNLGNEPDLFARPNDAAAARDWVSRMAGLIKEIDPDHPVTLGLHAASLVQDNGLRVHEIFDRLDLAVMHGYPMYADWAQGPLDPHFVPFLAALTTALCGKPTLMEEFGGPTAPFGQPSFTWEWTAFGDPRRVYMASEQEFAAYLQKVLPGLQAVGATGAMLWCYADYDPTLYGQPPLDESRHERYFGLVRSDGSLKAHARTLYEFAGANPTVQPPTRTVTLDLSPAEYYENPRHHAERLYHQFLTHRP